MARETLIPDDDCMDPRVPCKFDIRRFG